MIVDAIDVDIEETRLVKEFRDNAYWEAVRATTRHVAEGQEWQAHLFGQVAQRLLKRGYHKRGQPFLPSHPTPPFVCLCRRIL